MNIKNQELGPPKHVIELSRDFRRANQVPMSEKERIELWNEIAEDRRIAKEKAQQPKVKRVDKMELLKRLMGK